ncbi:unnamed protein product, partial [Meganyctiphanes norvegica]
MSLTIRCNIPIRIGLAKMLPRTLTTVLLVAGLTCDMTSGFLGRGSLLETEGDIFGIYCPEFNTATRVWHHREITREAVRRQVVKYFQDVPSPTGGVYNHRTGMTLEEAYAEYYGAQASPRPFLQAIRDIVDAQAEADAGGLGQDPRYHFGAERISESQAILQQRWRRLAEVASSGEVDQARYMLGLSLTAIQDFYSHTNWIELGNEEFNRNLGLTGATIDNVASQREETCLDCRLDDQVCKNNNIFQDIIDQGKLTSGYLDGYNIAGTSVEKPPGVGKCSHGGNRDASRSESPRGGINKELPTSCFSPHHHLHHKAAEQAVQATEWYLQLLRGGIGTEAWLQLLSLSPSTALVIVVDTTVSMAQELASLTHTVNRLVQLHAQQANPPTEYLLVPFNDPSYGPVYRSKTPDLIYQQLSRLRAVGGGDEPEPVLSALRLALLNAPPHSQVYIFTDASVKDRELFPVVAFLAHIKNIMVTPVITKRYNSFDGSFRSEPVNEYNYYKNEKNIDKNFKTLENNDNINYSNSERMGVQTRSGDTLLYDLSIRTGSHVVEMTQENVEATTKLINGQLYPKAIIAHKEGIKTQQTMTFPVDSLVQEFEVVLRGSLTAAILTSPTGSQFNLPFAANFEEEKGFKIIAITPSLIQASVNMTERFNEFGSWKLRLEPQSELSVHVYANTPMDVAAAFYIPGTYDTSPSMQRVWGMPSQGAFTYLDITITGVDTAKLRQVDAVRIIDQSNSEVYRENLSITSPRRNTYIQAPLKRLTTDKFYTLVVQGKDGSGYPFRRESQSILELGGAVIGFPLGREIWGPIGDTLAIPLTLTNTHATDTFFLQAYDATGGLSAQHITLSQRSVHIGSNETVSLTMKLVIHNQLPPGSSNSIILAATSAHGANALARAYFYVASLFNNDQTPPSCRITPQSSCNEDLNGNTCHNQRWQARIDVYDNQKVFKIETVPSQYIPNFIAGPSVAFTLQSLSCCEQRLDVQATDMNFNTGFCFVEIGKSPSEQAVSLGAAGISGIVLGSIAFLIIVIVLIVLIIRRRRRSKQVTLPRRGSRS